MSAAIDEAIDDDVFCCNRCGHRCGVNDDEMLVEQMCPQCDHDNSEDSEDVE